MIGEEEITEAVDGFPGQGWPTGVDHKAVIHHADVQSAQLPAQQLLDGALAEVHDYLDGAVPSLSVAVHKSRSFAWASGFMCGVLAARAECHRKEVQG